MSYNSISKQESSYFNEFINSEPVSIKHKFALQKQKVKITSRKLPSDFFKPHAKEIYDFDYDTKRINGKKTPCFGQERPESNSITVLRKNKFDPESFINRMQTMPEKRNLLTQPIAENQQIKHKEQYSCRLYQIDRMAHKSTERKLKKYQKKLTLDNIDEKSDKKRIYENRIRLNVKKFFKTEPLENTLGKEMKNTCEITKDSHKYGFNKLPPII